MPTPSLHNPVALLLGRAKVMLIMGAMWLVYRLLPCRLVMLFRVGVQMALLAWWYPDTYELNRFLPNLDHLFAAYDQALFGFQPALRFSQWAHWPLVSELMDMGYASYYPMMVVVLLFYFFCRYKEFQQCATILIGSFFIYYVVFDFLPVVGPTFYYKAVGLESIAQGVFPALGDYFNTHQGCLPSPGYTDGIFYQAVEQAKAAGERPRRLSPLRMWAFPPSVCCWPGIAASTNWCGCCCRSMCCSALPPSIYRPTMPLMPWQVSSPAASSTSFSVFSSNRKIVKSSNDKTSLY